MNASSRGTRLLTAAELDAVLGATLVDAASGASAADRAEARRRALDLAIELLELGRPLPKSLRGWLTEALRDLHAALEIGGKQQELTRALRGLGSLPRGRPPSDHVDLAAAVHVLVTRDGVAKGLAYQMVADAAHIDVDLVREACAGTTFESGTEPLFGAAAIGDRILAKLGNK